MYSALNYGSTGEQRAEKHRCELYKKNKKHSFFYCSLDLSSFPSSSSSFFFNVSFYVLITHDYHSHVCTIVLVVISQRYHLKVNLWKKERKIACLWSCSEGKSDRSVFFPLHRLLLLLSSSRSENATKCKSSHVLRTYLLPNVETIELIVSIDEFKQINNEYDFNFVS